MLANADLRVRPAEPCDEEDLVEVCRQIHQETGLRDAAGDPFPFDECKVRAMVQQVTTPRRNDPTAAHAFCGIIGPYGDIQASIYLTRAETWSSSRPYLKQEWSFVRPDHMKGPHARTLVAFSKVMAECWEQTLVGSLMTHNRIEAKKRFYAREYQVEPFGAFFVYNHPTQGA